MKKLNDMGEQPLPKQIRLLFADDLNGLEII